MIEEFFTIDSSFYRLLIGFTFRVPEEKGVSLSFLLTATCCEETINILDFSDAGSIVPLEKAVMILKRCRLG